MPSGKLRHSLRGHGHSLSAIVQVGKVGVTPGLVKQLEQALADHELVKVKVAADSPAGRFGVADQLGEIPGVNVVQIVGGAILLYKRHPRVARYEGKRAPDLVAGAENGTPTPPATPDADAKTKGKGKGKNKGKLTGKAKARAKGNRNPNRRDAPRSKLTRRPPRS
jgi:RNA-binding protein